jgi:hypothetical protein
MKLKEFIKNFSHNNLIRLHYNTKGGQELVLQDWNDVSMDWEVNKQQGLFRNYIDNEVLGLVGINFGGSKGMHYPEALNVIIERLENQPFLEDLINKNLNMRDNGN